MNKEITKITSTFSSTERMPVLFIGHGSPMNAIEENEFAIGWRNMGKTLPKPNAVLCISAHWENRETLGTTMKDQITHLDYRNFAKTKVVLFLFCFMGKKGDLWKRPGRTQ